MCGPTKFFATFDEVMLDLTKAGWAVFTIGSHRGADSSLNPAVHGYREIFEWLHMDKIAKSDAIIVINKGGYIGKHTAAEVDYAVNHGKAVYWLESNGAVPSWKALLSEELVKATPEAAV